jgi:pyridoxine kinase
MDDGKHETWAFALPTVRGYFAGVGDLFSAMVLAHFGKIDGEETSSKKLYFGVSQALLKVQQILLRTHIHSISHSRVAEHMPSNPDRQESLLPSDEELDQLDTSISGNGNRKVRRRRLKELRIVQERNLITADSPDGWPGSQLDWDHVLSP